MFLQNISTFTFKPEAKSAKIIPFTFKGEVQSLRTSSFKKALGQ
jgi:hypothetical protein